MSQVPLAVISLCLWALAIMLTKKSFRFDNTSGDWGSCNRFPTTLEQKEAQDAQELGSGCNRVGAWDYGRSVVVINWLNMYVVL